MHPKIPLLHPFHFSSKNIKQFPVHFGSMNIFFNLRLQETIF